MPRTMKLKHFTSASDLSRLILTLTSYTLELTTSVPAPFDSTGNRNRQILSGSIVLRECASCQVFRLLNFQKSKYLTTCKFNQVCDFSQSANKSSTNSLYSRPFPSFRRAILTPRCVCFLIYAVV